MRNPTLSHPHTPIPTHLRKPSTSPAVLYRPETNFLSHVLLRVACRFLRNIQQSQGDGDGADDGPSTEGLERILQGKLGLARLIHKLIVLEDAVYD
eukprot:363211-Chlamydomonas_euryale.AAC.7